MVTPAALARLTHRRPARRAGSVPLSRLLPRPVLSGLEAAREDIILDRLTTLTAATDPWTAARLMSGGTA